MLDGNKNQTVGGRILSDHGVLPTRAFVIRARLI
jgi:hypothetical protein